MWLDIFQGKGTWETLSGRIFINPRTDFSNRLWTNRKRLDRSIYERISPINIQPHLLKQTRNHKFEGKVNRQCWERSINGSLLTDYWCTLSVHNMACAIKTFYIVRAYFARRQFVLNWYIYMNVVDVPWHVIVQFTGCRRYWWHVSPYIITFFDTIVQM